MTVLRAPFLWASTNFFLAEQLPRYRFLRRAVRRFMPDEEPQDAFWQRRAASTRAAPRRDPDGRRLGLRCRDQRRSLDSRTGEELWVARLPANGTANPMTYRANGRQHEAIVAGGQVHAFRLP